MADIELVIKIPAKMYLNAKEDMLCGADVLVNAIKDGTLLPKGHGRLIDINEITAYGELECNGHNVASLDEFTTIIKADKESEDT